MAVAGAPDFDAARLAALAAETPRELRLLRLRLRFGLPPTLAADTRFRVVLELVDEMGQPVVLPAAQRQALEVRVVAEAVGRSGGFDLETRAVRTRRSAQPERTSCTWAIDAALSHTVVSCSEGSDDASPPVTLEFQLRRRHCDGDEQPAALKAAGSGFHAAFQRFCVQSEWLDAATLVLPTRTLPLRVAAGANSEATSSGCARRFSVPTPSGGAALVEIREDYGAAMGSHVWDASILLAFALCAARRVGRPSAGMLELGAGCGLLGVAYAVASEDAPLVLTERAESLALLRANLALNGAECAVAVPLVWGAPVERELPPVAALFACDVLYNWSAHEALLASIAALADAQQPAPVSVVLAHKHRGKATSAQLEAVLRGDPAGSCGAGCRWAAWSVTRAARLGAVDVLVLTRKPRGVDAPAR